MQTGIPPQTKADFLAGVHTLSDQYKVVLYTGASRMGPDVQRYTPDGEAEGKGYRRGGMLLKNARAWVDAQGAGCLTWDDVVMPNATVTARGYAIVNATKGGRVVCVVDWGADYTSTEGPFKVRIATDQINFE